MTMMRTIKVYKLPEKPETPGFRRMEEKDVDGVLELMRKKYSDYKLAVEFSKEEVVHWILPHENVSEKRTAATVTKKVPTSINDS
mmetsp:Transcript_531/g.992  ORF Transcript_531/g.992 Transcript_531/m.992 type:complete len:85 (-) Transcript_531:1529-1783(-)